MLRHRFKYGFRQRVRLEQMPEVQDRCLVRDRVAAKFEMTERAHRLDVVERLLGTRIGQGASRKTVLEVVPVLSMMGVTAMPTGTRQSCSPGNTATDDKMRWCSRLFAALRAAISK